MRNLHFAFTLARNADLVGETSLETQADLEVALLTGCQDKSYALGLAMALSLRGVRVDVIGNDRVYSPEFQKTPSLTFLNLGGIQQPEATFWKKLFKLLGYYVRLIRYVTFDGPKILHILWNYKFEHLDRTFLMAYFKLLGKKVVLTAHNVNAAKRDLEDSLPNRLTLRCQYRLADCVFAHTEKMKSEIVEEFGAKSDAVRVIPFGIYNVLPDTDLTPREAKKKLGIGSEERTIWPNRAVQRLGIFTCSISNGLRSPSELSADYRR